MDTSMGHGAAGTGFHQIAAALSAAGREPPEPPESRLLRLAAENIHPTDRVFEATAERISHAILGADDAAELLRALFDHLSPTAYRQAIGRLIQAAKPLAAQQGRLPGPRQVAASQPDTEEVSRSMGVSRTYDQLAARSSLVRNGGSGKGQGLPAERPSGPRPPAAVTETPVRAGGTDQDNGGHQASIVRPAPNPPRQNAASWRRMALDREYIAGKPLRFCTVSEVLGECARLRVARERIGDKLARLESLVDGLKGADVIGEHVSDDRANEILGTADEDRT